MADSTVSGACCHVDIGRRELAPAPVFHDQKYKIAIDQISRR